MIERGDIYFADLDPVTGSEQGGVRPVLVIQNDTGNKYSPTVIVAAITSNLAKARLPTHIIIDSDVLSEKSVVLLEQIRTIDKTRLIKKMGRLSESDMQRIDGAISISMGFENQKNNKN
jgi:mRNA interferase MazF